MQPPAEEPISAGQKLGKLSRVPYQPVRWPTLPQVNARITQITTAAQPSQIVNGFGVSNIASINMPKPVTISGITTKILNATSKQIGVSFLANPSDPNFQKVNVYLRVGTTLPVLIGSGTTSPITLTVPRAQRSGVVFVQAEGNWGPHPLPNSPSKTVYLL